MLFSFWATAQNNVGIGTLTPDASSILELKASDKGLLAPRTTKGLIASPVNGLIIYDTDTQCLIVYRSVFICRMADHGKDGLLNWYFAE